MKEKIQRTLDKLIGLELTRTTRAANMECLKFGQELVTDKVDGLINVGQFGIHLQCPWRITNGQKILIGHNDVYEQSDQDAKYDPDFDWDRPGVNLRDKKLQELIDKNLTVEKVTADDFGGFSIHFNDNISLTTFPTTSLENEYWRVLDNRPTSKGHFVVGGDGIWESD
ncbi:hypothetical protein [Algoriphagus taiwanensis]|uniref:Uncharacterized protein n=1 Tax=Algoriphagus taiwanensis TaxID=1445656 RepID=A0ABQ6Q268_9BACT|nr:hypothetical protein Ataiwa_19620 [Algoriphagus taiwanensis]